MQGLWCHSAKNIGQEKLGMGFLQISDMYYCNTAENISFFMKKAELLEVGRRRQNDIEAKA